MVGWLTFGPRLNLRFSYAVAMQLPGWLICGCAAELRFTLKNLCGASSADAGRADLRGPRLNLRFSYAVSLTFGQLCNCWVG